MKKYDVRRLKNHSAVCFSFLRRFILGFRGTTIVVIVYTKQSNYYSLFVEHAEVKARIETPGEGFEPSGPL
jgi:hypothetical protein